MGNNVTSDLQREQRISSIENLKQLPYVDNQHTRKKRSVIFNSAAWKRLVESTRRRGSKGSKVNPSHSYPDGNLYQSQHGNHLHVRHANGLPAGHDNSVKKSQSLYVINTKPPTSLANGVIDTKPVLQQPRLVTSRTNDTSKQAIQEQYKSLSVQQSRLSFANSNDRAVSCHDHSTKVSAVTKEEHKNLHSKPSIPHAEANKSESTTNKSAPKSTNNGAPPRKVVIQASTSELLRCLGEFICRRCHRVPDLDPSDISTWLRGVDRALLMQGWQDITFIMPSSVVFVYMLCREMIPESVTSVFEVQCIVLTCLYMSYSYMGNEISYPLRPFLIEPERYAFWNRCCRIMDKLSGKMLRINNDAQFFTTVFRDLKAYSGPSVPAPTYVHPIAPFRGNSMRAITVGGSGR